MPAALLRIEDAAHPAQGSTFVISGQNLDLEVLAVTVCLWVLAAATIASVAEVFLLAIVG